MKATPPKKALQFFRWFCREDYLEEIEGDLTEVFQKQCEGSPKKAKWKFAWSVIKYFRPEFMKSFKNSYQPHSYGMFKNYFKIGWRNLLKDKGYSFINIGGLAVGMAVAILIGLWVYDELSYNKSHKNYDRIVQIMKAGINEGIPYSGGLHLPYPLIDELKTSYGSNFKHIVEGAPPDEYILSYGQTKISRIGQFMAAGLPETLTLEMLQGKWDCLKDPHSILLSASAAKAL